MEADRDICQALAQHHKAGCRSRFGAVLPALKAARHQAQAVNFSLPLFTKKCDELLLPNGSLLRQVSRVSALGLDADDAGQRAC
ncbi:hypothetical protein D3C84_1183040 [compost metagenome]